MSAPANTASIPGTRSIAARGGTQPERIPASSIACCCSIDLGIRARRLR